MSAHTWQIWRVREAFSDSSGNEFRWGANRTLLEAFWTVIDVNQLNNLIEFVFVEGSEPSPYLCAHKISRLLHSFCRRPCEHLERKHARKLTLPSPHAFVVYLILHHRNPITKQVLLIRHHN